MEAVALLARAKAAGYRIEVRDGEILVRGPRHGHDALLAELRAAKTTLLVALGMPDAEAAAAELLANSVPFTTAAPRTECFCCGGMRHWRLREGCPWVCARCHPSARPAADLEWRHGDSPAGSSDLNLPPDPSTPGRAAANESEVSHG